MVDRGWTLLCQRKESTHGPLQRKEFPHGPLQRRQINGLRKVKVSPVDGRSAYGGHGGVNLGPEHRHLGAVWRTQDQHAVLHQVGSADNTAAGRNTMQFIPRKQQTLTQSMHMNPQNQTVEGQAVEGQAVEGQPVEGQTVEGQAL
ncbi:hypothetical protein EYF80_002598 [Liparis tanakae]|uniref:Uncharacterized protein n=1 Tax=Liparis tanakae TaxID=230148 RepID=A0A4Z2JBL6_9TELE|nr:hypothetical protein EYF80_002598 [Liparis tanakae]